MKAVDHRQIVFHSPAVTQIGFEPVVGSKSASRITESREGCGETYAVTKKDVIGRIGRRIATCTGRSCSNLGERKEPRKSSALNVIESHTITKHMVTNYLAAVVFNLMIGLRRCLGSKQIWSTTVGTASAEYAGSDHRCSYVDAQPGNGIVDSQWWFSVNN